MTGQECSRTKTFFKDTKRENYQVLTGGNGAGGTMMNSLYPIRTEEELGNGELNLGRGGGRVEKKERLPIESCSSGGGNE